MAIRKENLSGMVAVFMVFTITAYSCACAQTPPMTGPPLNLQLPNYNQPNWGYPLNTNFIALNAAFAAGTALTLTTNGTGGFATYSGGILNIPIYLPSTTQLPITKTPIANNFLTGYTSTTGVFTAAQPSFTNILGVASPAQLPQATASTLGVVQPDGTTITVSGGVISSAGSGISGMTAGQVPVAGSATTITSSKPVSSGTKIVTITGTVGSGDFPRFIGTDGALTDGGSNISLSAGGTGVTTGLTVLNASNLTSGTVPVARLPLGTAASPGAVQCDGTTITCTGGVIASSGGTVTHTIGALVLNSVIIGNEAGDIKSDTGCSTDGAGNETCASYSATGATNGAIVMTYTGIAGSSPGANQFKISPSLAITTPWTLSPAVAPATGIPVYTNSSGVVQETIQTGIFTGTCASGTYLTVVNGLITGCS